MCSLNRLDRVYRAEAKKPSRLQLLQAVDSVYDDDPLLVDSNLTQLDLAPSLQLDLKPSVTLTTRKPGSMPSGAKYSNKLEDA